MLLFVGGELDSVDWEVAAPEREVERVFGWGGLESVSMLSLPWGWLRAAFFAISAISRSIELRRFGG